MPEQIPTTISPCYGFNTRVYKPKSLTPISSGEYGRAWYEANKVTELEKKRAYYEANKDSIKERMRAWHEANPEYKRAYYEANKDSIKERMRAWREANPEYGRNKKAKRRASIIGELTPGLINKLLESQNWTCVTCSKGLRLSYHVDHIVPVSKGGQNVDSNIQILCPKCNLSKGNKDFAEFLNARGLDPSDLSGMLNPSETPTLEEA